MEGNTPLFCVYKEPHLQGKSDECAQIWEEWIVLFKNKDPREKEIRSKWSNVLQNLVI